MEVSSSLMFGSIRDKVRHGLAIAEHLSAALSTSSYLSYQDWHHLLVSQQIYLTDDEIAYCHKKCTDFHHKEHINLRKFIKGIDLLVPDTHTDPAQFEDVLPQPYRMIAKILEGDILDVAWLEIIRRQVVSPPFICSLIFTHTWFILCLDHCLCPINTLYQHSRQYTTLSAQPDAATYTLSRTLFCTLAYLLTLSQRSHSFTLSATLYTFLTFTLLLTPPLNAYFLPTPLYPLSYVLSVLPTILYSRSLTCSGCLMV